MITLILIGVTTLVSYMAFSNRELAEKMQFNAAKIVHQKEYYRLISHAFIHANWSHLIVNMLVLYFLANDVRSFICDNSWFNIAIEISFALSSIKSFITVFLILSSSGI